MRTDLDSPRELAAEAPIMSPAVTEHSLDVCSAGRAIDGQRGADLRPARIVDPGRGSNPGDPAGLEPGGPGGARTRGTRRGSNPGDPNQQNAKPAVTMIDDPLPVGAAKSTRRRT